MLGLRRAVGTEVVHWLGANKPAYKLDPGFLEHPRLSPRAVIGPGARFLEFFFTGPYADDATQEEEEMELLHRRCCGLDVHKETVVACLRLVSDGKVTTEVRTFQTTTADLLRLSEWLAANECTHVEMEATGEARGRELTEIFRRQAPTDRKKTRPGDGDRGLGETTKPRQSNTAAPIGNSLRTRRNLP